MGTHGAGPRPGHPGRGGTAGLLHAAAADLRRDRLARVEADTAALSVHLVVPLGLLFLPGFVLTTVVPIVLALTSERLLAP